MDNGSESYRRFLSGDKDGLVEIIRDYKDGLMLFINGFTKNIFTAEEITQEVFVKLYVKKPKFSGKSSFKTWLYAIGRNTAVDCLRKKGETEFVPIENTDFLSELTSTEASWFKQQNRLAVHTALEKLKPEYHQILWLIYFEEMNNEQAATVMGKSKNNTAVLLHRAKESLKTEMIKEGFNCEDL